MSYFRTTTDASDHYRPNSSAAGAAQPSTGVSGNLADMMRNATIFRVTFVAPPLMHVSTASPEMDVQGFYGAT